MSAVTAIPFGQQLPASLDVERAILGAILLNNACFGELAATLEPADFALDAHRLIYAEIAELISHGQSVDMITLVEALRRRDKVQAIGGVAYLSSLIDGVVERPSIGHYARIVRTDAILRRTIYGAEEISLAARHPAATLETIEPHVLQLLEEIARNRSRGSTIRHLADIPDPLSFDLGNIGYIVPDLIQRATVTLLSGEPGIGKSYLALKLVVSCSRGTDFLGKQCERIPCVLFDRENPLAIVRQRLTMLGNNPSSRPHIWGGWNTDPPPELGDPRLFEIAAKEKPLMVFDSLVRFHSADENSASEMRLVMAHLRRLADAGATVVALHHRAKSHEGSNYRGSSDILAAVDVAYVLKSDGGQLKLHRYKSRFGSELTLRIDADFAVGRFELTASEAESGLANALSVLQELIKKFPGMSTRRVWARIQENRVKTAPALARGRVEQLLRRHDGQLWRSAPGPRGAVQYFPIDGAGAPPQCPSSSVLGTGAVECPNAEYCEELGEAVRRKSVEGPGVAWVHGSSAGVPGRQ